MDPNTSPDTAVAIPEGPDADTQTPTNTMDIDADTQTPTDTMDIDADTQTPTNTMDIDAGEDEGLPRVGKFMYLIIVVVIVVVIWLVLLTLP
jgi:hypothetical protein